MTDKLDLESMNIAKDKQDKLKALFPEVFSEGKIDFDRLRATLGDIVDETNERYEMNWAGKKNCFRAIQEPSRGTLKPVMNDSEEFDTTENLYIEGDNLEVLKLLQKSYFEKVKMIYIDPPYNTGKDFVYPDDYKDNLKNYLELTGQVDSEGKKIKTNVDTDGRYHSNWMNMMYPRLFLARNLLKEDGVIFISIDDNEVTNLRKICDEIFGEENFVATIVWKHTQQSKNDEKHFSRQYNYNLVFAKDINNLKEFYFERTEEDNKNYSNPDNDPRGPWKADPFDAPNIRENLTYEIENPITKVKYLPPEGRHWRTEEPNYNKLYADKRIIFGSDGLGKPQLKVFYEEKKIFGEVPTTWLPGNDYGTTTSASKELKNIFGKKIFDYPKPVELIKYLLHLATKDGDIVLDSFAGSGSTAQAVLEQNQKDGFNRKFILIEMEEYAEEITANRIKKVIEGYEFTGTNKTELFKKNLTMAQILNSNVMEKLSTDIENIITKQTSNFDKISKSFKENVVTVTGQNNIKKFKKGIGGGFQYCELSEPLFDEYGYTRILFTKFNDGENNIFIL